MSNQPAWDCPNCKTRNTLDPAVVTFSKEVYERCDECGEHYKFNTAGKSA